MHSLSMAVTRNARSQVLIFGLPVDGLERPSVAAGGAVELPARFIPDGSLTVRLPDGRTGILPVSAHKDCLTAEELFLGVLGPKGFEWQVPAVIMQQEIFR